MNNKIEGNVLVEVFTGIRSTGSLTLANFVGAIAPILQIQETTKPLVFVADLHTMTDMEPSVARKYRYELVANYLALGLNPEITKIFIQSALTPQITEMMLYLMRHISVAELLRVPTLKDKLSSTQQESNANLLLANYPVMMAADILLQRARKVPVGDDQVPHIEVTRLLADRFNKKYGNVLIIPLVHQLQTVRILSLDGNGKMSKSNPKGAIFITDEDNVIAKKIRTAQTCGTGDMTPVLDSHFTLATTLANDESIRQEVSDLRLRHLNGEAVMVAFKGLLTKIVIDFLGKFRTIREEYIGNRDRVEGILEEGRDIAIKNANDTLNLVRVALEI